MKTHHMGPLRCPDCGAGHDVASGVNSDDVPEPGDWTICSGCGSALVFSSDGLRRPTETELEGVSEETRRHLAIGQKAVELGLVSPLIPPRN